jgi:hypothetical protein
VNGQLIPLSDSRWQYKCGIRTYYIRRVKPEPDEGEGVYSYRVEWLEKGDERSGLDIARSVEEFVAQIDRGSFLTATPAPVRRQTTKPTISAQPATSWPTPQGTYIPSVPAGSLFPSANANWNPTSACCFNCGSTRGGQCNNCRDALGRVLCPGCGLTSCYCSQASSNPTALCGGCGNVGYFCSCKPAASSSP